jgi:OFA family oxalate/formate antiporter-like MFS transporter
MKKPFYGWFIVAASVAMNCYLSIAFFQGFQVFFLPMVKEFGWSRAATSGAFSLRQLENGILAPLTGLLVQRWGARKVIFAGVLVGGIGLMTIGTINSLLAFYITFTIASVGVSGPSHGVSWPVIVSNWFRRLRGRALGLATMGPVLGGPFVVVAAVLNEWLGWRWAIVSLGLGLLIVGLPLSLVARSHPEPYGYYPDGDTHAIHDPEHNGEISSGGGGVTTLQAIKTKQFWIIALIFGGQFLAISGLHVHFIPLIEDMQYTTAQAATLFGVVFFLSGIGRLLAGSLADMIDYRMILAALLSFQLISFILLTQIHSGELLLLILFCLVHGVGFGGTIPLRPFVLARLFGRSSQAAILGLLQGVSIGTSVFGPIFYGWMFDVTGSYYYAIIISGVVVALVIPLVLALPRDPITARNAIN